jgi:hypothetical protein
LVVPVRRAKEAISKSNYRSMLAYGQLNHDLAKQFM